jgi:adenylate cyclase
MALGRKLGQQFYDMSGYYDLLEERIEEYKVNPPGADWDGVYVATSK